MAIKERMSGNEAVSYAIRQVNPDVMPAFPITPSYSEFFSLTNFVLFNFYYYTDEN